MANEPRRLTPLEAFDKASECRELAKRAHITYHKIMLEHMERKMQKLAL